MTHGALSWRSFLVPIVPVVFSARAIAGRVIVIPAVAASGWRARLNGWREGERAR